MKSSYNTTSIVAPPAPLASADANIMPDAISNGVM
jgi:hypothetical protein